MDRGHAADDCAALLALVEGIQARWRASPDALVRDLAPRLDELTRVLARLEHFFRREADPSGPGDGP